MYSYLVVGTICPNDLATVTVAVLAGPNAGQPNAVALCSSDAPINMIDSLLGTPDPSGTWSGPLGTPVSGMLDPATASAGAYTYSVAGNASCPDAVAVLTVSISGSVDAGGNGSITLCSSAAAVDLVTLLTGTPDAGGAWTDPNGDPTVALFDPSTGISGTYTYTVTAAAPCPSASSAVDVTVNAFPDAGGDSSVVVCDLDGPVALFDLLSGTPDVGGIWTGPNAVASNGTFVPGTDPAGNYTYAVNGAAPCGADSGRGRHQRERFTVCRHRWQPDHLRQ